ncbi:MAG: ATP-grasp fold amidoligase family protein [Pseudomonadota bacterium]
MRALSKQYLARYASRWRSTRHIEAHLRFPGMAFHEALTRVTYKRVFGAWPDLDDPKTISEKMCWLKVNDRRPLNAVVTDKWRMRAHVTDCGLGHMLNRILGVWEDPAEIDFAALPDAYVLKISNGSAMNIIRKPGTTLDEVQARRRLRRWVATDMADHKGEWYYAASPSRILAEAYLDNGEGDLPDYKLFVFNGEVRIIQFCEGRYQDLRSVFLDPDWHALPFSYASFRSYDRPLPPRPEYLDEMIGAAQRLAADFPLLRVDFYMHQGRPVLGELSLNPVGGYTVFRPDAWNRAIGDWLTLPPKHDLL